MIKNRLQKLMVILLFIFLMLFAATASFYLLNLIDSNVDQLLFLDRKMAAQVLF